MKCCSYYHVYYYTGFIHLLCGIKGQLVLWLAFMYIHYFSDVKLMAFWGMLEWDTPILFAFQETKTESG